jgi:hypothetical protein
MQTLLRKRLLSCLEYTSEREINNHFFSVAKFIGPTEACIDARISPFLTSFVILVVQTVGYHTCLFVSSLLDKMANLFHYSLLL